MHCNAGMCPTVPPRKTVNLEAVSSILTGRVFCRLMVAGEVVGNVVGDSSVNS
jgi:hypothetical protein